jgi:type I restriction enzyme S subunit
MEAVGELGGLALDIDKPLSDVGDGYSYFRNGDVLVAKITPCFENGKRALALGLTNGIGFGTTELHVLRPGSQLSRRFVFYLTLSDRFRKLGMADMYGAGGQKRVPTKFIEDFRFLLPPLPTQRAIASFLDRETAKIDRLIEKKERLLALLEERRTSAIDRFVVEGLRPTGFVETGSQFFPRIPTGWEMTPLRRLLRQMKRPVRVDAGETYSEIGIRSWGRGIFHKDPIRGSDLGDKRVFRLRPQDFVLNIVFAWEGAVAVVSAEEESMIASHRFPTFRHDSQRIRLDYLHLLMRSSHGRALMGLHSPGAAGRNRTIRLSAFLSEEVPLPPFAEQDAILSKRTKARTVETSLSQSTTHALTLLGEYRSALVSAAVTGQLKVATADEEAA